MFMTTTLAHYQLPLFGLTTPALGTEIGADQRSVFLRPISAAGEVGNDTWPATVEVKESALLPQAYRNWLAQITSYQGATGDAPGGSASPETGDGTEASAGSGETTEATGSGDSDMTEASGETAGTSGSTTGSTTGSTSGDNSGGTTNTSNAGGNGNDTNSNASTDGQANSNTNSTANGSGTSSGSGLLGGLLRL